MKRTLLAVSFSTLILAGCGGPSLAGDWTVSGGQIPPGASSKISFTGNTYKMNVDVNQQGVNLKLTSDGSYTLNGEELSMTTNNIAIDDSAVPAAFKAFLEPIKKQLETAKGKTQTGKIKIEGETATFEGKDDKGQPVSLTFTKVKS